ncbi:MAG: PH domain-containing protein [Micrococcales bacterium]|nr:PH domain-containing protein [Micrococcales bacterium]
MGFVEVPKRGERAFRRRLAPGERFVFVARKHWVTIAEPIATGVLSFVVVVFFMWQYEQETGQDASFLLVLWLVLGFRATYYYVEWWFGWFGSTQRRLLQQTGIVFHKVNMMPLEKVTDMSYTRSPLGQVLGYGQFVMESAGQDQALRKIQFIPYPDQTYELLVSTMFGPKDQPTRPTFEAAYEEDVDEILDDVRVYSIDEWEKMSAGSGDEMPPSFPPRAQDVGPSARPASEAPTGEIDVDTQVFDPADEVTLSSNPWQKAYHPLVTDPGDD